MSCPLCAAVGFEMFAAYATHKLVVCQTCGLVYQPYDRERDAAALIEEIYDEAWVSLREKYGQVTYLNHTVFNTLLLEMTAPGKGRLLEIGSGTGEFLYMAKCGGWETVGIEPSAASCGYAAAKYGLPLLRSMWSPELAARSGPYDAIVAWHVLEHMERPVTFLTEAASLLEPGGLIAFSVPNRESLMNEIHGVRSPLYTETDHLCHYDLGNVRQLAAAAGLRVHMLFTRQYVYGFEQLLADHPVLDGLSAEQRMGLIARLQGEGRGHEIICVAFPLTDRRAVS
ncbi:class I SAM-dependent methyltransferase [Paenibacillus sacheonensis]|uniref:Methyltransferase domain-containing protein n=1 Tax=Paenibacillus sacheonensis TaxID=742054 RepID=A0A7X4YK21_9BACL|nr:class I SAM-dependent methyltransferase [Paenibacillus sacheonensis]MBM7563933.1 2-polyprenyl-3-methyl-5-hydroxy-6-metoxy-1,4-benzoquinol methylase [Paenibacillus sacheonensis]NBC67722.1 methyltransferase domain-containing protein [Paenibacillus sacheonensis]